MGGRFAAPNDGSAGLGAPVIAPHYAAMIASLRPQAAVRLWNTLIAAGYLSPLNNVESLMFPAGSQCAVTSIVWNQLKGSWNLALQTLGWGRYLAERGRLVPITWQATTANSLLRRGYRLLVPDPSRPSPTSTPAPTATPTLSPTSTTWSLSRECEGPDEATVGQTIWRSNASVTQVHGQFGTTAEAPWPPKSGHVKYTHLNLPSTSQLVLKLRYSKYGSASVPIQIYLDDESAPRASLNPIDQGDWNRFVWTAPILLGSVGSGTHSIKFSTEGQQYGVADLDTFVLTAGPP